jgi:hypothetical protein
MKFRFVPYFHITKIHLEPILNHIAHRSSSMPSPNGGMITSSKHNSKAGIIHSLTFPSYDGLKKQIYLVEKQQSGLDTSYLDLESQHTPLLGHEDADQNFSQYLDRELRKITLFYESQAAELFEDVEDLEAQVEEQEETEMRNYPEFDEEDEDEEDEDGEGEETLQPGETSNPRKKGIVILQT